MSPDKEFKHKNDFSCTAFQGSKKVGFMKYVNRISDYSNYLDSKGIQWSVINVYARRTERFITRYYQGNKIPNRPHGLN